jgi:hypothetical protein
VQQFILLLFEAGLARAFQAQYVTACVTTQLMKVFRKQKSLKNLSCAPGGFAVS